MHETIVLDVGGTSIRSAAYDSASGDLSFLSSRVTPSFETMPGATGEQIAVELFKELREAIAYTARGDHPARVVLAMPGPVFRSNTVERMPTIFGSISLPPVHVATRLKAWLPASSMIVVNDVTAAGYGYVSADRRDFCIITVGSGIGQKLFINGAVVTGARGGGGEIGHLRTDFSPDAPICDCGERGHVSGASSGRGVLRYAHRMAMTDRQNFEWSTLGQLVHGDPNAITNVDIVRAFASHCQWVASVLAVSFRPLAQAVAAVHLAAGVDDILIMGGFATALGEAFKDIVADLVAKCSWDKAINWRERIQLSDPSPRLSLVGCGRFADSFTSFPDQHTPVAQHNALSLHV